MRAQICRMLVGGLLVLGWMLLSLPAATLGAPLPDAAGLPPIVTDLGTLGGAFSFPQAINNRAQVVGFSAPGSGSGFAAQHAFFWENGVMTDLGTLNGSSSDAVAVNDAGEVAGSALNAAGQTHAVLWLRAGKGHRSFLPLLAR